MQDFIKVSLNPGSHDSFFAIFDAHGGPEAGDFARKNLMERTTQQKGFHSEEQWKIVKAIKDGFVSVPSEMWRHRSNLTCDMVHKKVKTNPRFILQEKKRPFSEARVVLRGTGLLRI